MIDQESEKESFFNNFRVSYETRAKMEVYAQRLIEANAQHNLVAASTLSCLWRRHFLDSAQLFPLLPSPDICLVDLGSGAGFPGLVLALLGVREVHLVESIGKKARFLEGVAAELGLKVTIHHARIESIREVKADIVTARAVTALPGLLSLAKPFLKEKAQCLFLKGEKADAELTEASKWWTFHVERISSLSDPSGTILCFRDVKVRHDARRKPRK